MIEIPTILVVDDEADLVTTYARLLGRQGYRVVAAGTCREALEAIRSEHLQLVVADLRLPDGDGLQVVQAARATAASTPVIVVTGLGSATNRARSAAAGATAYLEKPFSLASFADLVTSLVGPPAAAGRPEPIENQPP